MPRPDAERPPRPSILDRLIDREPRVSTEPEGGGPRRAADVKEAVKRDLEWLLNSRQSPEQPPPGWPHLVGSLLTFGLPDFSAISLASVRDRERLRGAIEEAVGRFEPRLTGVSVSIVEGREAERGLKFRIDALLRAEPEPEPVTFDSVLEPDTKAFVVEAD